MKALLIVFLWVTAVHSWNSCSDEPFCDRIRNGPVIQSDFVFSEGYMVNPSGVLSELIDRNTNRTYPISISAYEGGIFRITANDRIVPRVQLEQVLDDPALASITLTNLFNGIQINSGDSYAIIEYSPFRISIYKNYQLILLINDQRRLVYNSDADDLSIAVDFTFTDATTAYGIPLHAERFSLQNTGPGGLEPYRLYNVDHCCYDNFIQDSLYGAEPVLYGHSIRRTVGVFWLNAAQTFVDINRIPYQVESLFVSEAGILDFFVLTGPTFDDCAIQYIKLTGPAPLQQYFTFGYHQSRWSYESQEDAETVLRQLDNYDFPVESIWFDVDYQDGARSFTWNLTAFPDPVGMQNWMASTGRRVILIIHPHFKVEPGYFVYDVASANGYFVKNPNGTDFVGQGWPGDSSWIDFLNPEARAYISSLYLKENFPNTTDNVYVWNDMNEPEVFDGFERSWPRDVVFYNYTNREVHNIFSFSQVKGTYEGLKARYENRKRPYLLTRSHFSGSQRYTIMWTGDNNSTWSHLQISFPMCLSSAIGGISNCGADIGGFAGNLTDELLQRWYQAGAWIPFFRAHSTRYVERREPFLYPPDVRTRLRNAMRERYYYLPLWYTLFYEHERYGRPVIRPMVYHYPSDINTHDMDNQWLVGADVLVCPVAEEGVTSIGVYFPGGSSEVWFDMTNNLMYYGIGYYSVPVTMDSIPVFHRGGSIIARTEVHRPASDLMHTDPYSIYVFLDMNYQASSTLYIDDNESFDYRDGVYNYYRLEHNGTVLSISIIDPEAIYPGAVFTIDSVLVYRPPTTYKQAVTRDGTKYDVVYGDNNTYAAIKNVHIDVGREMTIEFV